MHTQVFIHVIKYTQDAYYSDLSKIRVQGTKTKPKEKRSYFS